MKTLMGISGKKMASVGFLLAVLFITLTLGSITFLINDNAATLPNIGLEGNCNRESMKKRQEGMTSENSQTMISNMEDMKKNIKNAPPDHLISK